MRIKLASTMVCLLLASNCAYAARVSLSDTEGQPDAAATDVSLSGDGRYAAFASEATNLVAGDTNGVRDIFVRDNQAGTTELISISTGGGAADDYSGQPEISPDGRYVVFWSYASNLVSGDTNGQSDVFVRDRSTGLTDRVSVDSNGNEQPAGSFGGSISDNGANVAFYTLADIGPNDTNDNWDVYVHNRFNNSTALISETSGGIAAGSSFEPRISPNGDLVAFDSSASTIVGSDTNGVSDVFVHSRQVDITISPSLSGNGASYLGDVTGEWFDGHLLFSSTATNLDPADTNGVRDIFMFDTSGLSSSLTRITDFTTASSEPSMTANANLVAFASGGDVHVWNRFSGTALMSENSFGDPLDAPAHGPAVSTDGGAVAFVTTATNTGLGDTNGTADIFVRRTYRPSVTGVSGELFPGTVAPIVVDGSFRTGDQIYIEGNGIVAITVTSQNSTQIQATVEIAAGTPTDDLRNLWVVRSSPALGINYPLGAADRSTVYIGSGG